MIGVRGHTNDQVIAEAVSRLSRSEVTPRGYVIDTPLVFPDGGTVVVSVSMDGAGVAFVSDMGLAYSEAELYGASAGMISSAGKQTAAAAGISFDDHAFFSTMVRPKKIAGAIMSIANCALEMVHRIYFEMEEKKKETDSILAYERLVSVFGPGLVAKGTKFSGVSSHAWPVKARVEKDGILGLFEASKPNHQSVVNVVAKFHDIGKLESPPRRFVVVNSISEMGELSNVVEHACDAIIEVRDTDERFERLMAA